MITGGKRWRRYKFCHRVNLSATARPGHPVILTKPSHKKADHQKELSEDHEFTNVAGKLIEVARQRREVPLNCFRKTQNEHHYSIPRHCADELLAVVNDVSEYDRGLYHANLREGRTAVSVLVRNAAQREQMTDILEEFNPVDMDDGTETGTAPVSMGAEQGEYASARSGQARAGAPGPTTEDEQVIPVVKEELAVGKRASERRYRIRTYVVETPVEEQVTLRDERVIVERRPASGEAPTGAGAMQERVFEVTERHEEPVVEKRAREAEEVVVRKEANERVETVRDTVRETKVDVDKEPADRTADVGGTIPPNRNP